MSLADNLRFLRERAGYSQDRLGEMIGRGQSTIQKIEDGRTKRPRDSDKLAQVLGVTEKELLYSDMDELQRKFSQEFRRSGSIQVYDSTGDLPTDDEVVFVKFSKDLSAACGDGFINSEHTEGHTFPFYLNSLHKAGVRDTEKVIIGYAEGSSNEPAIPDGSAIGIDTGYRRIKHGEIYLLTIDGKEKLKQIDILEEGRFKVVSLNPDKSDFPDEIYDAQRMADEQFIIRGRLFWVSWMRRA